MTTSSNYRINLLPPYVRQWALTRHIVIAFSVIAMVSIFTCLAAFLILSSQAQAMEQKALVAESAKKRTDAVRAQIIDTLAQVQPIQDKLTFVQKVNDYRKQWSDLYTKLAILTAPSGFIYTDAAVSGATMTIKAYSPKVHDVTVYLQAMYHEPDFQSVVVDKVIGFPANTRHLYFLDGHLVFADGISSASSASAASSGSAPGATQTQGGGDAPSGYTPDQVGPNGSDNLPPGVGPPPPQIAVKFLGGFGAATPAGATVAAAPGSDRGAISSAAGDSDGYSPAFLRVAERNMSPFTPPQIRDQILKQALGRVIIQTVPKGFDITVTATLKQPLTPPTPPGMTPPAGSPSSLSTPASTSGANDQGG